jgi:hypothetical protein
MLPCWCLSDSSGVTASDANPARVRWPKLATESLDRSQPDGDAVHLGPIGDWVPGHKNPLELPRISRFCPPVLLLVGARRTAAAVRVALEVRDCVSDRKRADAVVVPHLAGDRGGAYRPAADSPVGVYKRARQATETVHGHVFDRALDRADITTGDITLHTLRHVALSRMIATRYDDYTVMAISGRSSTRMHATRIRPKNGRSAR